MKTEEEVDRLLSVLSLRKSELESMRGSFGWGQDNEESRNDFELFRINTLMALAGWYMNLVPTEDTPIHEYLRSIGYRP